MHPSQRTYACACGARSERLAHPPPRHLLGERVPSGYTRPVTRAHDDGRGDRPSGFGLVGASEPHDPRTALPLERVRTSEQIEALARDFDSIVESCESEAYDDEHDPEGHTIAFERQQVAALLRDARSHLVEIDHAIVRLGEGTYGTCELCGGPIAPERLTTRPASRTCVACAIQPRGALW